MQAIFLDTETNGLDPNKHKILEIAYQIIDLYSGEKKESYQAIINQPESIWEKSNLKSLEINGFTLEELKKGKQEKDVAFEIIKSFEKHSIQNENSVYICQNPSFDRAFFFQLIDSDKQNVLGWPYHWLDLASMYWALTLKKASQNQSQFPWETGFSKDLIATQYKLPTEENPHRAMNGVNHLILCYKNVVSFPFSTA